MGSFTFDVHGRTSEISTSFNPFIQLEGNHEMALINLETYYSFPNIDVDNNVFRYAEVSDDVEDRNVRWEKIEIPVGAYDIIDMYEIIKLKLKENNHCDDVNDTYPIIFEINFNTSQCIVLISVELIR